MTDVVSFCSDLIRFQSISPNDAGVLQHLSRFLNSIGFEAQILTFSSPNGGNTVSNLFAKYGESKRKILGFLGHVDVVPAGTGWDAFSAIIQNDTLIGRGVADMKGGVAAFCCAVEKYIKNSFDGTIEIFLTSDEESGSAEGTPSLLKWAQNRNVMPNDCLIGEPSSDKTVGDRIYLGHRGSMNVMVKSYGKQGHVAYESVNSLTHLCQYITRVANYNWRYEDKRFPKTKIEPTLLFTNNYAVNVVPDESSANINIRYGADYSADELRRIFTNAIMNSDIELEFSVSGDSYYCESNLQDMLTRSIQQVVSLTPELSAAGGISDGRYMIKYCNVIEFGLSDSTIHQKNERVPIADLYNLEKIYAEFLQRYFSC